jgi:hypothetical protein
VVRVGVALVGVRALTTATGNQDYRLGYAAAKWERSPVMREIESLPRGQWVVTNSPEAVYLKTGRHARGLPPKYSSTSLEKNSNYSKSLTELIDEARTHDGVFAMFDAVKGRPWLPKATELENGPRIQVVQRFDDGVLLAPAS